MNNKEDKDLMMRQQAFYIQRIDDTATVADPNHLSNIISEMEDNIPELTEALKNDCPLNDVNLYVMKVLSIRRKQLEYIKEVHALKSLIETTKKIIKI